MATRQFCSDSPCTNTCATNGHCTYIFSSFSGATYSPQLSLNMFLALSTILIAPFAITSATSPVHIHPSSEKASFVLSSLRQYPLKMAVPQYCSSPLGWGRSVWRYCILGRSLRRNLVFGLGPPTVPAPLASSRWVTVISKPSVKPQPSWRGHEKAIFKKVSTSPLMGAAPVLIRRTLPPKIARMALKTDLSQVGWVKRPEVKRACCFSLRALLKSHWTKQLFVLTPSRILESKISGRDTLWTEPISLILGPVFDFVRLSIFQMFQMSLLFIQISAQSCNGALSALPLFGHNPKSKQGSRVQAHGWEQAYLPQFLAGCKISCCQSRRVPPGIINGPLSTYYSCNFMSQISKIQNP